MSTQDASQWYKIMKYIREAPGRVYADDVAKMMNDSCCGTGKAAQQNKAIERLNANKPSNLQGCCFLRQDPLTKGIFSIPSQRRELDEALYSHFANTKTPYRYNKHLYSDSSESVGGWSMKDIERVAKDEGIVRLDSNGYLHIDLTRLPSNEIRVSNPTLQSAVQFVNERFNDNGCLHIGPGDFQRSRPCIDKFDLQKLVDNFGGSNVAGIGGFKADGVVFTGETKFVFNSNYEDSPPLKRGLCLRGATFCGDVEVRNVTFDLSGEGQMEAGYNTSKVDFRDVRFFGKVSFLNVRFMGNSPDAELSLEDARIQHECENVGNEIEFNNVDFGNTHLNCFQMIVGEYVYGLSDGDLKFNRTACDKRNKCTPRDKRKNIIRFNNVLFGDGAVIDFTDAEIDNGLIEISNISALPLSYFCFASKVELSYINDIENHLSPCNYLSFSNCEIQKSLHIKNVSELSFKNTQNYGKIVAADGWGKIDDCEKLKRNKFLGEPIENRFLQAMHNACKCQKLSKADMAKSFVMLKENFAEMGLYDDEDDAFVLYMGYKPGLNTEARKRKQYKKPKNAVFYIFDSIRSGSYNFLRFVGTYGTAPFRILASLFVVILAFALIYWLCAFTSSEMVFSLGQTLTNTPPGNANFWIALLYSLGNVIPFVSAFEPIGKIVCAFTVLENAIGTFLVGYFSVAVVRKTLR